MLKAGWAKAYALLWAAGTTAMTVVGGAVCLLKFTWSVAGVVGVGVTLGVVIFRSQRSAPAAAVTAATLFTLLTTAVLGWAALTNGQLSLGLLVCLGLLAPQGAPGGQWRRRHLPYWIVTLLGHVGGRRQPRTDRAPSTSSPAVNGWSGLDRPTTSSADVQALTDAQLSLEWRRSCIELLRLQPTRDTRRQVKLVERRQAFLDEFEQRSPAGFARWLATGAQPGSDPLRILASDWRPAHPDRRAPGPPRPAEEGGSTDAG